MAPALCLSVCVIKVWCHISVVKVGCHISVVKVGCHISVVKVGCHIRVVTADSIYSLWTKNCQSAWGERYGGGGGGGGVHRYGGGVWGCMLVWNEAVAVMC